LTDLENNETPLTPETRQRLQDLRGRLLTLHKAILDTERLSYERAHGRIESPHALLQLVMRDPWFGWFRPVSEIVVQIDELLESKDPVTEAAGQSLLREVRSLINPAEEGEEFAVKYRAILQADPDIILMHAEVSKLLA